MLLRQIYDEDLAHAAWLIGCQKTGEAIVFDPARDVDQYLHLASTHGMRITATAETHIHAHVYTDVYTHTKDLIMATNSRVTTHPWLSTCCYP